MSVIGTFHGAACAQGSEGLLVERAAGAETCPDAVSLSQRIAAIRGRPLTSSRLSYEVYFTRTGDSFSAAIVSGPSGESRRVLEGRGTCTALAQATAVTLALLFDSDAESAAKPEVEPAPALAPEPERSRALPATLPPPAPGARAHATLSVGVAGLAFVVRPLAPSFSGELGLRMRRFRAGLGVLWTPTQSLALDAGQMTVSLLTGTARACVALTQTPSIELDLCSGLFAGAATGKADGPGISDNAAQTRSYLALPLEVSLADLSPAFGWEVSATALAGLAHQDFVVEGLPPAFRAPRIGAILTVRVFALWPW